jgi:drug/metabolite transporter (DMT)-like permease
VILISRFAPAIFVFLWSTGFIGVKFGIPYAPPFSFIALRMAIACILLALITFAITKSFRMTRQGLWKSSLVGLALHGAYLGGCFYAVAQGVTAGVVALIVCLQPVVVSVLAVIFLKESLEKRRVLGLSLGLAGVFLVIAPRIFTNSQSHISWLSLLACVIALFGGSLGTLAQKKFGTDVEVLPGITVQYGATALVIGALALIFEEPEIAWTGEFVFALLWLVIALSLGAILLLFLLLKRSSAASVSSLYYLVPPVTSLMAYIFFGEEISLLMGIGTCVAISGVWLVTREEKRPQR